MKFAEYKNFNLSQINKQVLKYWKDNGVFESSIKEGKEIPPLYFTKGRPRQMGFLGFIM